MHVCKRVIYKGSVQGVGFRYAAQRTAEGFEVSGYVRNLPGGSVELTAEGMDGEVDRFLNAVSTAMSGNIQQVQIADMPSGGFRGFQIRYD